MKFSRLLFVTVALASSVCALRQRALAQSPDQNLPTPVLSNEVTGTIVALDLGDPRSTRHFYALEATPGDLLITLQSKNLDGDIDLFTAITFRPLMKTTIYGSGQSQEITKGIYLRTRQILILRVEARTPNDEPGTYRVHFGGTFQKFSGGIPVAENTQPPELTPEKSGANLLSSVGATIARPPAEVVEPAATPSPEKPSEETAAKTTPATKPAATSRRTTRAPRRGSRPTPPRSTTASGTTEPSKPEPKKTEENPVTEKTAPAEEKAKGQEIAPEPAGARLVIEQKDGTKSYRPMSAVRRVVVEGGTIVIVLKSGRVERIQMANVARFAIEP